MCYLTNLHKGTCAGILLHQACSHILLDLDVPLKYTYIFEINVSLQ